jgi:hypothetical protein
MSYAKTSLRADKQALREKMQAMGLDHRQIADEFARRYQVRPRAALREAYGWSLKEAAERINAFRGDAGLDPRVVAPCSSLGFACHRLPCSSGGGHAPLSEPGSSSPLTCSQPDQSTLCIRERRSGPSGIPGRPEDI